MGHSAKGVSKSRFLKSCRAIGVVATDAELLALFDKYDSNGSWSLRRHINHRHDVECLPLVATTVTIHHRG